MKTLKWTINLKNMSGECEKCEVHTLDCQCKPALHNAYCIGFTAPNGGHIEIKANMEIDQEQDIGPDEEIEGLHYIVVYNGISCPFYSQTKVGAMAIALGIQWAAYFPINYGEL